MIRHRYGIDPATGKPGFYKVDHGPATARLKGTHLAPAGSRPGANNGRVRQTGRSSS